MTAAMLDAEPRTNAQQYDPAAERAVLGAVLFAAANGGGSDVVSQVTNLLDSSDFYDPKHELIFRRIARLVAAGEPAHPISVIAAMTAEELRRISNGAYVHDCMAAGNPAEGTYYAGKVREWSALRKARQLVFRLSSRASAVAAEDVGELIQLIQDEAGKLELGTTRTAFVDHDRTNLDVMDFVERATAEATSAAVGSLTGYSDLDQIIGGAKSGQLIIVAARPAVGKTTAAINWAVNVAMRQKRAALVFSLEMSRIEMGVAVVSAGARIPKTALDRGDLSDEEWGRFARFAADTAGTPLYYDDSASVTLAHIEAGIREKLAEHGSLGLVVVDQLNLIVGSGRAASREQEVGDLSRQLKLLAKKYNVPIVLLHQINRGPEQRTDKRPQLSDLRDSGQVEANADVVLLLHREDYYDEESPRAGEIDIIIAKHRGGPTGTVTLASQLHLCRFVSMAIAD